MCARETQREVCCLCIACVHVSVSARETGTESKSDRALCLTVYVSKPLLCYGFLPATVSFEVEQETILMGTHT